MNAPLWRGFYCRLVEDFNFPVILTVIRMLYLIVNTSSLRKDVYFDESSYTYSNFFSFSSFVFWMALWVSVQRVTSPFWVFFCVPLSAECFSSACISKWFGKTLSIVKFKYSCFNQNPYDCMIERWVLEGNVSNEFTTTLDWNNDSFIK